MSSDSLSPPPVTQEAHASLAAKPKSARKAAAPKKATAPAPTTKVKSTVKKPTIAKEASGRPSWKDIIKVVMPIFVRGSATNCSAYYIGMYP